MRVLAVVLCLLAPALAFGARTETPPVGFEALSGVDALPLLVDWPAYQASSYSRQNKNQDAGNFLRVEPDGEQVLVDTEGPGVVYRVWSTGVVGTQMSDKCRLRFWFDGETKPRLDMSVAEFFGGQGSRWPFVPPLAVTFESGAGAGEGPCNLSYVPIPFSKHLKVTGRNLMFYHVDYHRLPPGTPIQSFSLEEAQKHRASLEKTAMLWDSLPGSPSYKNAQADSFRDALLAPGKSRVIRFEKTGVLKELQLKLSDPSPKVLRSLVLQIAFENANNACVRAPVGDFFGTGAGEHLFKSLFCGMTRTGYYARWPMPFRKMASVELKNEGGTPVMVESMRVVCERTTPPRNAGYFHARYEENQDIPMREDYHILQVAGRGKLVGCNVTMQNARNAQGIFFLEGDEKIYVDGEQWPPRWLGTGTEDYFNGAYFWNHADKAAMARPLGGLTFLDWGIGRVCAYRWHFPDYVNFTKDIKLDLEHGGESDWPGHYASVAYYYLDKPVSQKPLPALSDRLPRTTLASAPNFQCCELIGPVTLAGTELPKRTFRELEAEFESEDGAFVGQGRAGERLEAQIEIRGEDEFKPVLFVCGGPEFTPVRASIDSKVLGTISPRRPSFTPWLEFQLPPVRLGKGSHKLVLELLEPGPGAVRQTSAAGLVSVQLHPNSPFVDKWSVVGNWPCPKTNGWEHIWEPETNQDVNVSFTLPDGREARWKQVAANSVGLSGGDWLVAYGLSYIWSPDDRSIPLFIGKDDGLKVWVNDQTVFDRNTWSHAIPDQFFASAKLRAGWNKLLVKCANWNGGWAFMVRPGDPDHKLRFAYKPE